MAVTFDAVGPAGGAGTSGTGTTLTWTHVMSASVGGALVAWISVGPQSGGDGGISTTATYNGVAMSSLGIAHTGGGTAGYVQGFYLLNPATGSNSVVVTRSGGSGTIDLVGGSISATGVNSLGVPVVNASAGSQTTVSNVIASASGDLVVSGAGAGQALTAFNQTLDNRTTVNTLSGAGNAQSGHAAGAASVTLTHTVGAADFLGAVGVNLSATVPATFVKPANPGKTWRSWFKARRPLPVIATPNPRLLAGPVTGSAITLDSPPFNWDPGALVVVGITSTGSINGQTLNSVAATNWTGGAWTIVGVAPPAISSIGAYIAYAVAGSTAQTTPSVFTATFASASADNQLFVAQFSGQDPSTPVDVTASTSAQSGTTATTPTLTLGNAPTVADWTFSVYGSRNANPAPVVGSTGFQPMTSLTHTSPSASMLGQWRTGSTSTAVDAAGMNTVGNSGAAIVIKASSGGGGPTPISLSDTGAGVDAITVSATVPLTETGTGVDALTVTATVPLSDTGTGVDAISVGIPVPLSDTGTGTDAITVSPAIPLSDTGTGVDALSVTATVALTDPSGATTDALSVVGTIPLSDARPAATDALSVSATVPLADARPAATDALSVSATVPLSDTGTGTDAISVATGSNPSLTESGTGTDSLTVTATVPLTETVSGSDSISVSFTVASYRFVSPVAVGGRGGDDRWWKQTAVTHSVSILKTGLFYTPVQSPSNEQITAADVTYLGGHEYTVNQAEADALTAAGYGAGLTLIS